MGAIDEAEGEEEGDDDADDELAAFDAMRLGTDVFPLSPHTMGEHCEHCEHLH